MAPIASPDDNATRAFAAFATALSFEDLPPHAVASPLAPRTVEQLAQMVYDLERLDDVSRLAALAGGASL